MQCPLVLPKAAFAQLFKALADIGAVYAPVSVSASSYSFKPVLEPIEIAFQALRTILPPKKLFYRQHEALARFDDGAIFPCQPEAAAKVIFGLHPCDLAGLAVMDRIFGAAPADNQYGALRENTLVVGLSCLPDRYCFCQSMGTDCCTTGCDIFLTDIGDSYFLELHSALAKQVLSKIKVHLRPAENADSDSYKRFWSDRAARFESGFEPNNVRALVDIEQNHEIWAELGKRCLSCGSCTPVCPTCYCFDVVDIAELNGTSGTRERQWDSCQFSSFAMVAGGASFRATPTERLKFWYRHKLHGFEDAYGLPTCVGCGRCTVACPAGIDDIVAVAKALQSAGKRAGGESG